MGRAVDAGAATPSGAVRARAAPDREAPGGMPARHDGDGEPRGHAAGRRRRRGTLRLQPAVHPGRRRGAPRAGSRHQGLRDQGRGPHDLLRAHSRGVGASRRHHDGRRRRPRRGAAHDRPESPGRPRAAGAQVGGDAVSGRPQSTRGWRDRIDRGDDDGRDPPQGDGEGRRAAVSRHRGQRLAHEASVRQPLRDRSVHARRHHPRDEPAHRREHGGSGGVWVVRSRLRHAGARCRRERARHRDRPDEGARGPDGRLPGRDDGSGRSGGRSVRDADRQCRGHQSRAHESDEGRRSGGQLGALQRGNRPRGTEEGGKRTGTRARIRGGVGRSCSCSPTDASSISRPPRGILPA